VKILLFSNGPVIKVFAYQGIVGIMPVSIKAVAASATITAHQSNDNLNPLGGVSATGATGLLSSSVVIGILSWVIGNKKSQPERLALEMPKVVDET